MVVRRGFVFLSCLSFYDIVCYTGVRTFIGGGGVTLSWRPISGAYLLENFPHWQQLLTHTDYTSELLLQCRLPTWRVVVQLLQLSPNTWQARLPCRQPTYQPFRAERVDEVLFDSVVEGCKTLFRTCSWSISNIVRLTRFSISLLSNPQAVIIFWEHPESCNLWFIESVHRSLTHRLIHLDISTSLLITPTGDSQYTELSTVSVGSTSTLFHHWSSIGIREK